MAGEKILIVEDEGIVARETEYRLKDLGYEVCGVAASGAEAIKKAEEACPDVIVMDIMLKGEMDGIDAAEQIHSRLGVPIVYVTAHADETTLQRAKRTRPMGYLLKPFNERELHAAIEIAIYKQTAENSPRNSQQMLENRFNSIAAPAKVGIVHENEDCYRAAFESVGFAAFVAGRDSMISLVNDEFEKLSGWPREQLERRKSWHEFVVNEDLNTAREYLALLLDDPGESPRCHDLRVLSKDGEIIDMRLTATILDGSDRIVFSLADMRERKWADEKSRVSLQAKDVYLKEIHHRVKNNLQVVSSLLHLQSKNVSDPKTLSILLESVERVRSIALIHEQLYKSADLTHVNFKTYLTSLARNLLQTYGIGEGEVKLHIQIDERVSLTLDNAIPCGLIVNELVSNALKHAFVELTGNKVSIELRQNDNGTASLIVSDNGVGLPLHVDFHRPLSLGLQLVNTLVNQLGATIQSTCNKGTAVTVTFAQCELLMG